jgi:hypothetical protein
MVQSFAAYFATDMRATPQGGCCILSCSDRFPFMCAHMAPRYRKRGIHAANMPLFDLVTWSSCSRKAWCGFDARARTKSGERPLRLSNFLSVTGWGRMRSLVRGSLGMPKSRRAMVCAVYRRNNLAMRPSRCGVKSCSDVRMPQPRYPSTSSVDSDIT